jgi:hypothetical protein
VAPGGKVQYQMQLACKCGRSGVATYEENESPPHQTDTHGYDNRKLLDIEGDFRADSGDDPPIYGRACGAKVA